MRILKYTLLFGLLLSPIVLFTQLSLSGAELKAEEAVQRGRASAVKRLEQAIGTLRSTVRARLDVFTTAASERRFEHIEHERGTWEVWVLDAELEPLVPHLAACPPLEGTMPDKELAQLYRTWLRTRDTAALRRTAARLFCGSASPRLQAVALSRLASLSAGAGETDAALEQLALLLARFPGARDVTGLPLGPPAALERVRLLRAAGKLGEARRAALELVNDMTFGRYGLTGLEGSLWADEARQEITELASDSTVPPAEREAIARALSCPFQHVLQRLRASPGTNEPDGGIERIGGHDFLQFERRVGDLLLLAYAPADELSHVFNTALGSPYLDGYEVFFGREIPAEQAERFEAVLSQDLPYLGTSLVLGADRAQLVALRQTRQTYQKSMVSIMLLMWVLAAYLIARDVRRHLELARLKSEFIANVGHELKTPLTTIRMFAETLFHGRHKKERESDYLKKILTESDHLSMLIDNVLQLSRAEEAVIDSRLGPTTLPRLVQQAVDQVKVRWEDRAVDVDVPELEIVCDANLVVLAIANLLDNAAKYGDPAQAIQVRAGRDRRLLWVSVEDRGRGIPAAEQRYIFQRFYRAKNALERKGMGLGLFLVQKIADLHGGKVEFLSREGVGTTFTVRLPVRAKS